jgi:hypothetical protein
MTVKVGDVVYLWSHAYLRLIGRVTAILGQRRVSLSDASVVAADDGGYAGFFQRGVAAGGMTTTHYVGDVKDVTYLAAIDFPFSLPQKKGSQK